MSYFPDPPLGHRQAEHAVLSLSLRGPKRYRVTLVENEKLTWESHIISKFKNCKNLFGKKSGLIFLKMETIADNSKYSKWSKALFLTNWWKNKNLIKVYTCKAWHSKFSMAKIVDLRENLPWKELSSVKIWQKWRKVSGKIEPSL